jgi:hypothetical protein
LDFYALKKCSTDLGFNIPVHDWQVPTEHYRLDTILEETQCNFEHKAHNKNIIQTFNLPLF